ncbi:MAG: hypothetical protein QME49_08895, partial [bacterium]|nr:hypothetical protein [bacterium]
LSLKGFDREQIVGCHTKLQVKRLSVGYTGYASRLEGVDRATTTTARSATSGRGASSYSVMGPYLVIDMPAFQISGESAWSQATNTTESGWIIRMEKVKTPYVIKCFVYDFDKGFYSPYGHISGIKKMQDTSGGSVYISRCQRGSLCQRGKGRLSTIKASYDYSRDNNYHLWIMACCKLSKRIRIKCWIENTKDKIAYTERIFWDITPDIYSTLGLRQEKYDGKNGGYIFLESTYNPYTATVIKARIKFQDNMTMDDYKEYSFQLVQQALKKHIKLIGRWTLKAYQDNTSDSRTNLEMETRW